MSVTVDTGADNLRDELFRIVRLCPWLMQALELAAALNLDAWCIAAGAVRDLVWHYRYHGEVSMLPNDVDLVYFSQQPEPSQADLQAALTQRMPELNWEVINQAWVHRWHKNHLGQLVKPVFNLQQALAGWPETATAVGVYLDRQGALQVIAPFGLSDLFAGIVRHNAAAVDVSVFRQRLLSKRFVEKWPELQVICQASASRSA